MEKLGLCGGSVKGKECSFSLSLLPRRWPARKIVCVTVILPANEPLGMGLA